MARPPQSTEFHYGNYVRFIVKLFQFSIVPLPPLPSLAFWTIYSAKDFPFEITTEGGGRVVMYLTRTVGVVLLNQPYQPVIFTGTLTLILPRSRTGTR